MAAPSSSSGAGLGDAVRLAQVDQRCDVVGAVAACDEALVAGDEQFVAVLHRHRAWDIAAGLGEAEAPTELA